MHCCRRSQGSWSRRSAKRRGAALPFPCVPTAFAAAKTAPFPAGPHQESSGEHQQGGGRIVHRCVACCVCRCAVPRAFWRVPCVALVLSLLSIESPPAHPAAVCTARDGLARGFHDARLSPLVQMKHRLTGFSRFGAPKMPPLSLCLLSCCKRFSKRFSKRKGGGANASERQCLCFPALLCCCPIGRAPQ